MGVLATARGDPRAHKEVMMGTVRYTVLDGEIVSENRNGVKRDYVPDPLGSTVALLDNTQTITDTFSYFPSGTVASRTGMTATPFQFVGTKGYHADASGKTYVRARVLEPQKGRWLTQDPIGFAGGNLNVYLCVHNWPVTLIDPSGLSTFTTGQCEEKCQDLVEKGKLKPGQLGACELICRRWDSQPKACSNLRRYCNHINGHSGESPGGKRDFKICTTLYTGLCNLPWERSAQECSAFTRGLANCSDGIGVVLCVGVATCLVCGGLAAAGSLSAGDETVVVVAQ